MSQKRVTAPSSAPPQKTLAQVLNVSKPVSNENHPSIIDVNHVFVSTFPSQWSLVTNDEYRKLELTPENTKKKRSLWEDNPYYAIKFKSPFSTYRFFVEAEGGDRWFVLARPPEDLKLYARGEPGWECGS